MQKQFNTVNIIGTMVSDISMHDLQLHFNHCIEQKIKTRVCVTPVNCLTEAYKSPELKAIYNSADFVLCDGMPVLWASRLLGKPIIERITGLDLLPQYLAVCAEKKYRIYFLGAKEGVAQTLADQLTIKYPGIQIVGLYSPPFAAYFSAEENNKMVQLINAAKPDIVFVSFTAPKQDYWIANHLQLLDTSIAIGVGGAFEVVAGLIPRAPIFFQRNGLEWLYRFFQEPRRLFRRYFIEAPIFIPLVFQQLLRGRD